MIPGVKILFPCPPPYRFKKSPYNQVLYIASAAAAAAACMRACVAAFVIDTIYELTRRRRPRRGESNFRMEIFEINGHGQKDELGALCPELALLSVPINLEYFYTEI